MCAHRGLCPFREGEAALVAGSGRTQMAEAGALAPAPALPLPPWAAVREEGAQGCQQLHPDLALGPALEEPGQHPLATQTPASVPAGPYEVSLGL